MHKVKTKSKKPDKGQSTKEDKTAVEHQGQHGSASEAAVTSAAASGSAPPPLASPTSTRPSPTAWFTTEIQHMMFGFGDCRKPLLESAALIEEVVHHQMTTLLYQACDVANMRGSRFISIEDFLFLMRKDKVKLKRFIKYMTFKDLKSSSLKQPSVDEEESQEQTFEGKQPPKKKRKLCYDFLSSIDQNGELLALFEDDGMDDIKRDRLLRAEVSSRSMNTHQYLEFCEARQASFAPKYKSQKFKDWLMVGVNVEPKPNPLAIEVLCYMAYETVAQLVDFALLVRRDARATLQDPVALSLPGSCINNDNLYSAHMLQQHLQQQASKSPSRAGSPSATPPSTPTTPSPMTSPTGPGLSTPPASTTASSKSKPSKKRKKSESSSLKEFGCVEAIQPNDILEVLRRYGQSIGPFAAFSKEPVLPSRQQMFCL